jgi:hypothetical protein
MCKLIPFVMRTVTLSEWIVITRAGCKFRGLTLLLQVGTSWRCGDGIVFEVPP